MGRITDSKLNARNFYEADHIPFTTFKLPSKMAKR